MAGMASSITVKYLYNNGYLNKFIVKLVKLLHVIASRAVLMSTRISPKNVASINDSSPLVLLSPVNENVKSMIRTAGIMNSCILINPY